MELGGIREHTDTGIHNKTQTEAEAETEAERYPGRGSDRIGTGKVAVQRASTLATRHKAQSRKALTGSGTVVCRPGTEQ